jgi:uncharacterized DUF497 family protein
MSPRFVEFWVSESAARHMLEKHDVTVEEALEAAYSTDAWTPLHAAPDDSPNWTPEPRYGIPGKTDDGRRLWVIVAHEGSGVGRILTAFEPASATARARHRRMRGN